MIRTYSEACQYKTFGDRLAYLTLGDDNAKSPRDISIMFYKRDPRWKPVRQFIIKRDYGCDLGIIGQDISGPIIIHHINPISREDIINDSSMLLDPENLICVKITTHNLIHYRRKVITTITERHPDDMLLV